MRSKNSVVSDNQIGSLWKRYSAINSVLCNLPHICRLPLFYKLLVYKLLGADFATRPDV